MVRVQKLPFWRTVIDAHVITFRNFLDLLRIGWVWVLLLVVADIALHVALWPWEEQASKDGGTGSWTLLLLSTFLWTLVGACVAVPWHRYVLKGDVLSARSVLELASDVRRYFGWVFLLSWFFWAPSFGMLFVGDSVIAAGAGQAPTETVDPLEAEDGMACACLLIVPAVLFAVLVPLSYVPLRLSLVLPAIALQHNEFGGRGSWQATRGNFWRLFLGTCLSFTVTLLLLVVWILLVGLEDTPSLGTALRDSLIAGSIFFLAGMVAVTFLSLAYRHLVLEQSTTAAETPLA